MTLDEFMATAPAADEFGKPIYYHIGSKVSFIMVVAPEEYKEHSTIWEKKYRDEFHARAMQQFVTATVDYKVFPMFEDENIAQFYAFKGDLEARKKAKEKAKKTFVNALDKLAGFQPFGLREVTEVYDRITGGKVVEITGDEEAPFWDRQEYERGIEKWSK